MTMMSGAPRLLPPELDSTVADCLFVLEGWAVDATSSGTCTALSSYAGPCPSYSALVRLSNPGRICFAVEEGGELQGLPARLACVRGLFRSVAFFWEWEVNV